MTVTEAVRSRYSVRDFEPTPVDQQTVEALLKDAARSPSGGNLQPWHIYLLTGEPLRKLVADARRRAKDFPTGQSSEYDVYPPKLKEPYRSRRYKCGEDLYASIGVPREDREGRLRQFARNLEAFGAPVLAFFALDRCMGPGQWAHLGMYMQTLALLARERGLHTCMQEAWARWYEVVTEHLELPEHLMLYSGMAIGYANESAPINGWRTDRAPLGDFATLLGY